MRKAHIVELLLATEVLSTVWSRDRCVAVVAGKTDVFKVFCVRDKAEAECVAREIHYAQVAAALGAGVPVYGAFTLDPQRFIRSITMPRTKPLDVLASFAKALEGSNAGFAVLRMARGTMLEHARVPASELAAQLNAAVASLHSASLLHGDIKPSNCVLDADGCAKLIDFGLTRKLSPGDAACIAWPAGTEKWMHPILARDFCLARLHRYTPEDDLWALCCTLKELAADRARESGTEQTEPLDAVAEREGAVDEPVGVAAAPTAAAAAEQSAVADPDAAPNADDDAAELAAVAAEQPRATGAAAGAADAAGAPCKGPKRSGRVLAAKYGVSGAQTERMPLRPIARGN